MASIPEARAIRQKLSFGSLEEETPVGKLDGKKKKKGRNTTKRTSIGFDGKEATSPTTAELVAGSTPREVCMSDDGTVTGNKTEDGLDATLPTIESVLNIGGSPLLEKGHTDISEQQMKKSNGVETHTNPDGDVEKRTPPVLEEQTAVGVTGWGHEEHVGELIPVDREMLDMMAAQPLQGRGGVIRAESPHPNDSEMDTLGGNCSPKRCHDIVNPNSNNTNEMDEDFPPLGKGRTKSLRANFEKGDSQPDLRKKGQNPFGQPDKETRGEASGGVSTVEQQHNAWGGTGNNQVTAAQRIARSDVSQRSTRAVPFDPLQIKEIGFSGTSQGIPSIYFSKADNDYLAERLGHAIVGKFSHSIPTSHQIQKSLDGIGFIGSISWKFINAKHIIIQLQKTADYATLLNGPNGLPVWMVDRHPMRVFKWTTEFNPFFETPIAAVWCNLIGLPIHLYETSALFAIGKLLGTPIQIDHATHDQTRLSFARLCIEIDISQSPPDEIIIDILGKEVHQKVKWDRIPSYCTECRHVGHSIATCYAFAKRAPPVRRDYSKANQGQGSRSYGKGHTAPGRQNMHRFENFEREPHIKGSKMSSAPTVTSNSFHMLARSETEEGEAGKGKETADDISSRGQNTNTNRDRRPIVDNEGFQRVTHKKDRQPRHQPEDLNACLPYIIRANQNEAGEGSKHHSRSLSPPSVREPRSFGSEMPSFFLDKPVESIDKPKFYKMLDNGEFDTEEFEEDEDMAEDDPEGVTKEVEPGNVLLLTEGTAQGPVTDCNTSKKARISTSTENEPSL